MKYGLLIYEVEHIGDEANALEALREVAGDVTVTLRDYEHDERIAVTCRTEATEVQLRAALTAANVCVDRIYELEKRAV